MTATAVLDRPTTRPSTPAQAGPRFLIPPTVIATIGVGADGRIVRRLGQPISRTLG